MPEQSSPESLQYILSQAVIFDPQNALKNFVGNVKIVPVLHRQVVLWTKRMPPCIFYFDSR